MAEDSSDTKAGIVVLIVLVFFGFSKCGGDDEVKPSGEEGRVVMPDLVGMTVERADNRFSNFVFGGPGDDLDLYDWEAADYSALDRWVSDGWRVVATSPKPGQTLSDDTIVRYFALRSSEIRWYKTHHRVPRVILNQPTRQTMSQTGPFAGVRSLVSFRYAPEFNPGHGWRGDRLVRRKEQGVRFDPRPATRREYDPRDKLKDAGEWSDDLLSVRTAHSGSKVQMGQVMTLLVKDKPEPEYGYGGDSDGGGGLGLGFGYDDDDDFNIPGWACPTRFC